MSRLESAKRLMRRWLWSIPFFVVLGLVLGALISIPVIPKPEIATITISGVILEQAHANDIVKMLRYAASEDSIKAVVLQINSPGGAAFVFEQIYLDVLRLRQQMPVVASIGAVGASGGYYIAVASNFIYAEPSSIVGSVGAGVLLPTSEELDEDIIRTGPFKATGGSRRKAIGSLETLKQEFVTAVTTQRGDRLNISEEELSRADVYSGSQCLRYGLIDDIGTRTAAIEKAAKLAGIRNYDVVELHTWLTYLSWFFGSSDMEELKSQTRVPIYYYLYIEQE